MWIMHPEFGFLSIVQKHDQPPRYLTVRSRSRSHLECFRDWAHDHGDPGPIKEKAGSDYAYRCVVPRSVVAAVMKEAIQHIDYANFKDECQKKRQSPAWLQTLVQIWQATFLFQKQNG